MKPKTTPLCIIFSRFPRPGRSKTRLISQLGPQGAAQLQKQMTERLISAAGLLTQQHTSLAVELHMADATDHEMQSWLGDTYPWLSQQGAELGERMAHSFSTGFANGFRPIILAGADCPDMDSIILKQALDKLTDHDVVLGPANDGGYYLIGLQQPQPSLFTTMDWGQANIFSETKKRVSRAGLKLATLATLPDIDRPADLAFLPAKMVGLAAQNSDSSILTSEFY